MWDLGVWEGLDVNFGHLVWKKEVLSCFEGKKNTKTVLQVSSLNQSFLFEMGTTQQNSLSKHCHNCLSETLASSLFTALLFLWYPGVSQSLMCLFSQHCFHRHMLLCPFASCHQVLRLIWGAQSCRVGFVHSLRSWDFWIAGWKVLLPLPTVFFQPLSWLLRYGEKPEETIPESFQVSV